MRWLQILRAILNFLYFFAWVSAICAPLLAFMAAGGIDVNAAGLDTGIIKSKPVLYLVMGFIVVGYFFYLAMIHHLRKAVYQINLRQLLSQDLKRHLYRAGLFCVIGGLLTKLPAAVYKYIVAPLLISEQVGIRATVDLGYGFDSILVILAFGIFMIIFSKIIERSLMLQEENALTV
ncbi:MAG: hypothetical protein WBG46_02395 [Nonlabens sp.]